MSEFDLPLSEITFDDKTRQRKDLTEIEGLTESIRRIGLLNSIIVDNSNKLLAGRRRVEAYRRLGYSSIRARRYESLDPAEQRLVELDENIRRVDLSWKEKAFAVEELHRLKGGTLDATADYIGLDGRWVSRCVAVAAELRIGNPKILACTGLRQAAELLERRKTLEFQTALSEMTDDFFEETSAVREPSSDSNSELGLDIAPQGLSFRTDGAGVNPSRPSQPHHCPFRIQQADFFQFAADYRGPPFNFIHCDFPYGIGFDKSDAARVEGHESQYEDSEELFWKLTAVIGESKNLIADSSHMLFWFSMRYYDELVEYLEASGWWVHYLPLIWHKSDGSGIASDFRRRPKHIYETALWCSRGDRPISRLVNDLVSSPIARAVEGHVSAKPLSVLRHFFQLGVNDLSSVLDPTCGSGTAIRTAADLGAKSGLGLELNPESAKNAEVKLGAFLEALKKEEAL